MLELILWLAAFVVVSALVQLVILKGTEKRFRPLRFLPLAAVAFLCIQAWRAWGGSGIFIGLGGLAAMLYLIQAGVILAGWALAWAIWRWWKKRKVGTK